MPAELVFSSEKPEISVVIPSLDGDRNGNVQFLVSQVKRQSISSLEIILSVGETPNGHARNVGVEISRGKWLIFIDDDVTLGHDRVLENIIQPLKNCSTVGMTGPSQLVPPNARFFQRWCARQIPRSFSPIVDDLTDSDMVSHMCLAISKSLFLEVGRENDLLLAGTDPDLRFRVRQAGYRIVVVPQTWAYHPAPDSLRKVASFAFKKGSYSAWQYRFARNLTYECPDGHTGNFRVRTTLPFRIFRKIGRVAKEVLYFRPLGVIYDFSYSVGYLIGLTRRWS